MLALFIPTHSERCGDQDLCCETKKALFVRLGPHRPEAFGTRFAMNSCTPALLPPNPWVSLAVRNNAQSPEVPGPAMQIPLPPRQTHPRKTSGVRLRSQCLRGTDPKATLQNSCGYAGPRSRGKRHPPMQWPRAGVPSTRNAGTKCV